MTSPDASALVELALGLLKVQRDAVVIEDTERRLVFVNQAACDVIGVSTKPGDFIGRSSVEFYRAARLVEPDAFTQRSDERVAGGLPAVDNWQLEDGRVLAQEYIPIGDGPIGHGWVMRHVTVAQTDEGTLQRRVDEALSATQAKSAFLATMSHEIRTPLNAIVGMTELASRSVLTPQQRSYISSIQASSEALLALINDVLDFSKIEAGRLDIERVPMDPVHICREVVESQSIRAFAKGVEIWCRSTATVPRNVYGDPTRLRQVVMNLVGNAVKFTHSGHVEIRVDAGPASGTAVPIYIQVVDSGCGISSTDLGVIFDRFSQAPGANENRGGSGLGLTISRSLVAAMGGRLSCTSELEKGSTFSIELVLEMVEGTPDNRPSPARGNLAGRSIGMLGIGNVTLERALVAMLSERGVHVVRVDPMQKAIPVDLVIAPVGSAAVPSGLKVIWLTPPGARPPPHGVVLAKPVDEQKLDTALRHALGLPDDPAPVAVKHASRPRRAHILVVEDQRANQQVVRRLLEDLGYLVDIAPDGSRALTAAMHRVYDLVLMDIALGPTDGFQVTHRIRAHEQATHTPNTPVVALTAHATEPIRQRAMAAGMSDFLSKPVQPARLAATVAKWIDPTPRLLLVDDAPEHLKLLGHYLDLDGAYRLEFAASGQAALAALARFSFDLVLLDIQMPTMSGFDVMEAIAADATLSDLPVIAMTADYGADARARCLHAGFSDFLSKPLRQAQLQTLIEEVLSGASVGQDIGPRGRATTLRITLQDASPDHQLSQSVRVPMSMKQLVGEYLGILRSTIDRLRDLAEVEDFKGIAREAHNLKGSGGAYGFDKVTWLGGALGRASRNGEAASVHRLADELRQYVDTVTIEYTD